MNTKLLVAFGLAFVGGCAMSDFDLWKQSNAYAGAGGSGGADTDAGAGGTAEFCQCTQDAVNGNRLKKIMLEASDGTRAESGQFRDSKFGLNCSFQELPNGETRCVPKHVAMNTFSDEECKIPVYMIVANKSKCTPKLPTFVRFDLRDGVDCSSKFNGFRIGSADTSEPLTINFYNTLDENGTCTKHGFPTINDYGIAYSLTVLGGEDDFVKGQAPTEF